MNSYWDNSVYCSPLREVLSLDAPPPHDESCGLTRWEQVADPSQDAFANLNESALVCAAREFVSTLSPREQEVVRQIFWDGQRQADVARALGVSRMAVTKIVQKVVRLGQAHRTKFRSFSLN
jgi:DNA-directed RNA polymerase specialized sigma subunit